MSNKKFNPTEYKNKEIIYVATSGYLGILRIYQWSKRRKRYLPKTLGNKFYSTKRVSGKQVTKCFSSLNEAKIWKADTSESYLEDKTKSLTFKEVKEMFLEKKKSEVRIKTYDSYLDQLRYSAFFDKMKITEITLRTIDAWLAKIKSPDSLAKQKSTRLFFQSELSTINQVFGYYSEYLCEDTSFASPIKKRHFKDCFVSRSRYQEHRLKAKRKFLSGSEIERFLDTIKTTYQDQPLGPTYYLLAFFQLRTGTRIGEAAAVHWEDICFDSAKVHINRSVCWSRRKGRKTFISNTTKNGLSRVIPISQDLVMELKKFFLKEGRNRGLVFSRGDSSQLPLNYCNICYRYNRCLEIIGSEWRGTHLGRHSFATDYLEKTGNHRALQGMLGHQSSKQTDHYAKMTANTLEDGMKSYEMKILKSKSAI